MKWELDFGVYEFKLALVKGEIMPIKQATGICGERKFRVQKNYYRTSENQ